MTPIRLWSTLVTHSLQRYGTQPLIVMKARTPITTTMTKAPAKRGIGWSKGTARPGQLAEHAISPSSSSAPGLVSAIGPGPGGNV